MDDNTIKVSHHGEFTDTERFLEQCAHIFKLGKIDKYGEMGVKLLEQYTPKKTGLTSRSWYYDVTYNRETNTMELAWYNDNIQNGQHIAVILQEGHATRGGGYFEGIDYINPALAPVFQQIADDSFQEVFGVL